MSSEKSHLFVSVATARLVCYSFRDLTHFACPVKFFLGAPPAPGRHVVQKRHRVMMGKSVMPQWVISEGILLSGWSPHTRRGIATGMIVVDPRAAIQLLDWLWVDDWVTIG